MKIIYFFLAFTFIYLIWFNSIVSKPKQDNTINLDHVEIVEPDSSQLEEVPEPFIILSFDIENYQGKTQSITDYVKRFYSTALIEQELYGIPVSIKLAQGILESGAGSSNLARKVNNHFGIKWRDWGKYAHLTRGSYTCSEGKFTIFSTAWACWRAHSIVLQAKRYENLYMVDDYVSWAQGLQHYGYAEDPNYAKKLIRVIEENNLHLLD